MKTITDYEMRIIAFVDILGFKNLVDESVSDHYSYLRIHDALEDFRKVKKEKENEFYDRDVKVTTFSDSLVISYPLDFVGGLFHILYDLTYLQFILLQKRLQRIRNPRLQRRRRKRLLRQNRSPRDRKFRRL